ncbi:MAG TPA: DUF1570 domain-containing protein [Kofleriaceae bacterium]
MQARARLVGMAAIAASACSSVIPQLPSLGGPGWIEVRSEHFTLWTDASGRRGRELVREMEHHWQVIGRAMNAPQTGRSFVIALRDAQETAAYLPRNVVAAVWDSDGPTLQPGIVLSAYAHDYDHVISHELSHVISSGIIANQPHWLSEGIATYFEMADLDAGQASVQIGIPRDDRTGYLHAHPPINAGELFACRDHTCIDGAFYATSWATVSFLLNTRFDQLATFFARLNALPHGRRGEVWRQAWTEAFPDLPPAQLDRQLGEWLVTGQVHLPRITVASRDYPATGRWLDDADALAARSLLKLMFSHDIEAVTDQLTQALALDRTNVLARLVEASLHQAVAPADARATAAAHPDDWRAWWLVAFALQPKPAAAGERSRALARMCALLGEDPDRCAHSPTHQTVK